MEKGEKEWRATFFCWFVMATTKQDETRGGGGGAKGE